MAGIGDSASASAVVVSEARSVEVAAKEVHDVVVGGAFLASLHLFLQNPNYIRFSQDLTTASGRAPSQARGTLGERSLKKTAHL